LGLLLGQAHQLLQLIIASMAFTLSGFERVMRNGSEVLSVKLAAGPHGIWVNRY
jgi:hypothetical protein